MAVLEQLSKEIVDAEHRLFAFRVAWRNATSRLTYLSLFFEIAYIIYWWFFTSAAVTPVDTALHILILLSIPIVYVSLFAFTPQSYPSSPTSCTLPSRPHAFTHQFEPPRAITVFLCFEALLLLLQPQDTHSHPCFGSNCCMYGCVDGISWYC